MRPETTNKRWCLLTSSIPILARIPSLTMKHPCSFVVPIALLLYTHVMRCRSIDIVQPETSIDHVPVKPEGARYCVDTSYSNFVCADDPMEIRQRYDSPALVAEMHTGIPQRIDGTEQEQKGIREVLFQMDEYFFREVLANPEYREVRQFCRNRNELCAFWAYVGECESNRLFMLPNCPAACRICLLLDTNLF